MKLAYKIVAINPDDTMVSPISYAGLSVEYKMGRWAKAKVWKYLFVYKTFKDSKRVFNKINKHLRGIQNLAIIECEVQNMRKAVGNSFVTEYRCTRLKPLKVVQE